MKDLFGNENVIIPKKRPENFNAVVAHHKLLQIHGSVENRCKNCKHLVAKEFGKKYFKCLVFTPNATGCASTDWRANWQACGKFEKDE